MNGVSVSDILKILDQIPGWKAVAGLPKRVAELEARVKALEGAGAGKPAVPNPKECAMCGATMRVNREEPHVHFGDMGVKTHLMVCDDCGHQTELMFTPGKGYK
jgi:hypothetical protein